MKGTQYDLFGGRRAVDSTVKPKRIRRRPLKLPIKAFTTHFGLPSTKKVDEDLSDKPFEFDEVITPIKPKGEYEDNKLLLGWKMRKKRKGTRGLANEIEIINPHGEVAIVPYLSKFAAVAVKQLFEVLGAEVAN